MEELKLAQQLAAQAIDKTFPTHQLYVIPQCVMVAQTVQQKNHERLQLLSMLI